MKIDKKILDDITHLSKQMEKNNLNSLKISDGKFLYELTKGFTSEIRKNQFAEKDIEISPKKDANQSEKSLKSPLVGTAYLSPEPGAKSFIEIGQNVKIGQVLLIIEAMKTMNEITADKNGVIKKIYIKNETPVEFGEPLVLIE